MLLLLEVLVPWLIVVVVTMIVVTYLARRWGRDPFGWLLLSAAMGPIAIVALMGTRSADVERGRRPSTTGTPRLPVHARILVGCDGSDAGLRIADHIERHLSQSAEVFLACVLPLEAEPGRDKRAKLDCDAQVARMAEETLGILRVGTLASGRPAARTVVAFGQPGAEIVRLAEREQADLIIVGRRGAGLSRALLGSVSDYVTKHAKCPVLIVD